MSIIDNYYSIEEGRYYCNTYGIFNGENKIVFLVTYHNGDAYKKIAVNYYFSEKSFHITFEEIVTLLEMAGMPIDPLTMNKLYSKDLTYLTSLCNQYLLNKRLVLEVTYSKRNYKQLLLYWNSKYSYSCID